MQNCAKRFRAIVDHRVFASVETPFLLSRRSVNCIEIAVPASEKQNAVRQRGRGMHHITGFEFPTQIARARIERVKVSVPAAEINCAIRDDWT